MNKIKGSTGTRIVFPNDKDEDKELITIIGKKECVAKAKEQLLATIKDLEMLVEVKMTVNPKHYRHFVARRGEVLHKISQQYGGVTISFPRVGDSSDQVTLKGAKECVEGAKSRILEIVQDLEQIITIEVIINQRHHRTIMGPRGSKVQAINSDFDVQIKFPDKDSSIDYQQESQVNGDMNGENSEPRPQDIVCIIGKSENCEAAKEALLGLIPIVIEVPVAFSYHKYIIGQKGDNVRSMMSEFDVNIQVPPAQDQSDIIKISGPPSKVELAKEGLLKKVTQIEEEEEDRKLRSFQLQLEVDPEYHPKIIGRKGIIIGKLREKYSVNIQFPPQGESLITITGYEKNCEEAKAAILAITGNLDKMVRITVEIDNRVHSRLIGTKGRSIRKIMEDFKVEIKFSRKDDPNQVIIMGDEDAVEDCKDYLLNMAEEYLQDVYDEEDMRQYENPNSQHNSSNDSNKHDSTKPGFVVSGAPWAQQAPNMNSSEDFPSMGAPSIPAATNAPAWGPRR